MGKVKQALSRLWVAIKEFVRTMGRVLWNMPSGSITVTEAVQKERFDTCQACPDYNPDIDMCEVCFCKMSVKTALTEARCPRDLW